MSRLKSVSRSINDERKSCETSKDSGHWQQWRREFHRQGGGRHPVARILLEKGHSTWNRRILLEKGHSTRNPRILLEKGHLTWNRKKMAFSHPTTFDFDENWHIYRTMTKVYAGIFSPIWPLGSDLEAIKGHDFSRVLQHSKACSFCSNAFRRPKRLLK